MRDFLVKFSNVPADDILGARAPSLKLGSNVSEAFSQLPIEFIRVNNCNTRSICRNTDHKIVHFPTYSLFDDLIKMLGIKLIEEASLASTVLLHKLKKHNCLSSGFFSYFNNFFVFCDTAENLRVPHKFQL